MPADRSEPDAHLVTSPVVSAPHQFRFAEQLTSRITPIDDNISFSVVSQPASPALMFTSGANASGDSRPGAARMGQSTAVMSLSRESKDQDTLEFFVDQVTRRADNLVFVGESSPLSLLVRHLQDNGYLRMDSRRKQKSGDSPGSASSQSSMAASLPTDVLRDLLASYFEIVHPYYPLIKRRWFAQKFQDHDVPPLLLNAVCFAACYHCEASVIFRTGYKTREDAKEAFYAEAKRLFDLDEEEDSVIVLQAAILLSFHGGKPRKVWGSRAWLAVAVTISEDLGLHRSTSRVKMNEEDRSHLRLLWWCIVVRDMMTSFTWGRPPRTMESRLDFDMLTLKDFETDEDPEDPIFGRRDPKLCEYMVWNAKINLIMMKVICVRYSPRLFLDPTTSLNDLYAELLEWRRSLPPSLDWSVDPNSLTATYTCMTYHHVTIFIFRPMMQDLDVLEMCSLKRAVESASEIASLVGTLGVLEARRIPQDVYQVIATALGVLLSDVQSENSVISKFGLQICLMTLNQGKEHWDPGALLVKCFGRLQESRSSPTTLHTEDLDLDMLTSLFSPMEPLDTENQKRFGGI